MDERPVLFVNVAQGRTHGTAPIWQNSPTRDSGETVRTIPFNYSVEIDYHPSGDGVHFCLSV